MAVLIRKGYTAPKAPAAQTAQIPIREGYAAPQPTTPPQNVPTTTRPVSAVPPAKQ